MAINLFRHRSHLSMRDFYNYFFTYYPIVDFFLHGTLKEVIKGWIAPHSETKEESAIEYACGTGSLSLQISRYFKTMEGRDNALNMLIQAQQRARKQGLDINFTLGDLLTIEEEENSFDRVFVSFALHLFPPEQVESILHGLLAVARKNVMIIDHPRQWHFFTAIIEGLEGSHYKEFIGMDFESLAKRIGAASFTEETTSRARVLVFTKEPSNN